MQRDFARRTRVCQTDSSQNCRYFHIYHNSNVHVTALILRRTEPTRGNSKSLDPGRIVPDFAPPRHRGKRTLDFYILRILVWKISQYLASFRFMRKDDKELSWRIATSDSTAPAASLHGAATAREPVASGTAVFR
jgi:hypothetical protein